MVDPGEASDLALRDAVQEGDDDEPDDGEGGGGDHDVLLSHGCFRNSRARSGRSGARTKTDRMTGGWEGGSPGGRGLLRKWSVSFPTRG
jgi:hypothetical protein